MTTFDAKAFDKAMTEAPARLFTALRKNLGAYLHDFAKDTMTNEVGRNLTNRTGQLRQSFHHAMIGDSLGTLRGTVYTDSVYAATQEFDGEQTPSTRKYLTIPLDAALTPSGVSRGDLPHYGNKTFLVPHRRGWLVMLRTGIKRGRRSPAVPLFLLVRSVFIPGRLGFFRAWDADANKREEALMEAVDEALDGLGKAPGAE